MMIKCTVLLLNLMFVRGVEYLEDVEKFTCHTKIDTSGFTPWREEGEEITIHLQNILQKVSLINLRFTRDSGSLNSERDPCAPF